MVKLLTKKSITECPTYVLNAKGLIPEYYRESKFDSINILLDFIEYECGEWAMEFEVLEDLLKLDQNSFDDPMCGDEVLSRLFRPRSYSSFTYFSPIGMRSTILQRPQEETYDMFIGQLIQKILDESDSLSMSHLYCRYLLKDYAFIMDRLHEGELSETCLGEFYSKMISQFRVDLREKWRLHYSYNLGIWSPQGKNNIVGNKLALGGQFGFHKGRYIAQLSLFFRVLKSDNTYNINVDGVITPTDHYFGGYFGGEVGLEALKIRRFGLDLHAGIGYDGWDAFTPNDEASASIGSLNLNLGGTMRMFYNREHTRYFGIQGRYNFVKYDADGGTDLSGNTISIHLLLGFLGNQSVVNRGKYLSYYD